jgi:hypothetical protein
VNRPNRAVRPAGSDGPHPFRLGFQLANTGALPPDQRDAIRGGTAAKLFGL